MSTRSQEVAKFLAGIAASETLGHWWLGIWGGNVLPPKLPWFTFTSTMNTFAMIAWPVVLAALLYYAWVRKGGQPRSRQQSRFPATQNPTTP